MSNPIKKAFDRQLSGIQLDESRLRKTRSKPARPLRRALILAAALVIVAGAAYSANLYLGTIDWQGNKTPAETAPSPSPQPASAQQDEDERLYRAAHDALKMKPIEELWLAKFGQGWLSFFPKVMFNSLEEGEKLLEGSTSPLKLPGKIPSGFAFSHGEFSLYIDEKNDGKLKPLGEESPEEGLILRGFRLPADALSDFSAYTLYFVNKHGDSLSIEARMNSGDHDFGLWQGDSHKTLSIPGFANALFFEREGMRQLFARQAGFPPISVCRMDYFTDARQMEGYSLEPEVFTDITYRLRATSTTGEALSEEELTQLAAQMMK